MNSRQGAVIFFGIAGVIGIVMLTPRYKLTRIDSENYITTEQYSSLYKRSTGEVRRHWDKIALYSGGVAASCAVLVFLLREKQGR